MDNKLTSIITYCTIDFKFLETNLTQCSKVSDEIIIPICTHLFNGEAEDSILLQKSLDIIQNFPKARAIMFPWLGENFSSRYHTNLSRMVGTNVAKNDWLLFLDADEIIDNNFGNWFEKNKNSENAWSFTCYWYFREPIYQARETEAAGFLVRKKHCSKWNLENELERNQFFQKLHDDKLFVDGNQLRVEGLDGELLLHHFSWVRTKADLLKKVKTWGHNYEKDWTTLVEEEFSHSFNGSENIHNYNYNTVNNKFNIEIMEPSYDYIDTEPNQEHGIIHTNKFKVNADGDNRFFVVDNFYDDPYGVREFALNQTYFPGEGAVGARTRKQYLFNGLREKFEDIVGAKIPDHTDDGFGWHDIGINGRFQYCPAGTPSVFHCDSQKWAAVIYLTPDAPPQSGTSFFRHKETKIFHNTQINWEAGEGQKVFNQKTFVDPTPYELVDTVGNIFNRLVVFDGGLIHSGMNYFGWDIESSRLFHIFFFNTVS